MYGHCISAITYLSDGVQREFSVKGSERGFSGERVGCERGVVEVSVGVLGEVHEVDETLSHLVHGGQDLRWECKF